MIDRCGGVAGDLTDADWERLEPLLPSMDPQRGGRWRDHRQVINGILWRTENGAKWHQVPGAATRWVCTEPQFAERVRVIGAKWFALPGSAETDESRRPIDPPGRGK